MNNKFSIKTKMKTIFIASGAKLWYNLLSYLVSSSSLKFKILQVAGENNAFLKFLLQKLQWKTSEKDQIYVISIPRTKSKAKNLQTNLYKPCVWIIRQIFLIFSSWVVIVTNEWLHKRQNTSRRHCPWFEEYCTQIMTHKN